jgi:hypothetical protein
VAAVIAIDPRVGEQRHTADSGRTRLAAITIGQPSRAVSIRYSPECHDTEAKSLCVRGASG